MKRLDTYVGPLMERFRSDQKFSKRRLSARAVEQCQKPPPLQGSLSHAEMLGLAVPIQTPPSHGDDFCGFLMGHDQIKLFRYETQLFSFAPLMAVTQSTNIRSRYGRLTKHPCRCAPG
jgi:hypothetical protein